MPLDARYITSTDLWELFTDKDAGTFLRNGYVLFFEDNARTVGKPVYKITGSPPNYTYIEYGSLQGDGSWRVDLNDQGAFDSAVYYFPYASTDADALVELYFVQVFSADDVPQFSREAWPNVVADAGPSGTTIDFNYVPNPQFLIHANLPAEGTYEAGEVRDAETILSAGGWLFERPVGTTSKDFVTFPRYGSFIADPTANPRYAVQIECQVPNAGDTYKDLSLFFRHVNTFASPVAAPRTFTFSFWGLCNVGSSVNVELLIKKNYGTGGDAPTETSITTFNVVNSETQYSHSFTFGDNTGKNIGTLDDDFVEVTLRLPTDSASNTTFTDFILASGDLTNPLMPDTTAFEVRSASLAGGCTTPAYDNSDLYLPVILLPSGFGFDTSFIGKVFACVYETPDLGELLCDGAQYETAASSSDNIPYARLQAKLWNSTLNFPIFGTGDNYMSAVVSTPAQTLRINTNTIGAVTNTADGATATTFTFQTSHTGNDYSVYGLNAGNGFLYIKAALPGAVTAIAAGTSTFNVDMLVNSADAQFQAEIKAFPAAPLAGTYFTFSNTTTNYYVWFTVNGAGADPAPGGIGIQVGLLSTMTAADVAQSVAEALSGYQISLVTTVAGGSIAAGSYFTINTITDEYYVWYKVDGAGVDPAPVGKQGILVSILSADTNIQVASKTQIAINMKYFAVPDLRGMFIRGWDNGVGIDLLSAARWSKNPLINGDVIGSRQLTTNLAHTHGYVIPIDNSGGGLTPAATSLPDDTPFNLALTSDNSGTYESRPENVYLNYVIKY